MWDVCDKYVYENWSQSPRMVMITKWMTKTDNVSINIIYVYKWKLYWY